jgi:Leucine-rich repeat (LRR) protein
MSDGLHCTIFVMDLQLGHLVDSALLEHVEMSSGKVSIHDLYREFAILEAQGKLKDLDMKKRRWVYAKDALPTELEDEWSSWKMLTRVCISEKAGITSLRAIKWKRCTKLAVLKLDDLSELSGNLNLKDLIRLRSLTVETSGFSPLKVSIEGLKGLKTLTYFKMVCGRGEPGANVGQLPAALKVLEVDATVVFKRDVLALCTNLVSLKLESVYTSELDLKSCTSLRKLELIKNQGLKILKLGPNLQSLNISRCSNLVEVCGLDRLVDLLSLVLIGNQKLSTLPSLTGLKRLQTLICVDLDIDEVPGLDSLVGLKSLTLSGCGRLSKLPSLTGLQYLRKLNINMLRITEIPNLRGLEQLEDIFLSGRKISKLPSLTGLKRLHKLICVDLDILEVPGLEGLVGLKSLTLKGCRRLSKLPSLTALQCLRELDILGLGITEIPNLSGLEQLQVIDASRNSQLTSLQGLGDLRALKTIDLSRCESLCRLSDMSKLTNLKVLDLRFTGVELHEEDIHILEGLQVLEPVLVASPSEDRNDRNVSTYGLDFKKRKIMYLKSEPFYDYEGWQISYKSGWEEKGLHCPVGRCIEIRDVKNIWRISGRAVKFPGTDAGCISRR